eukprot:12642567-Prorocentrum_lima.AAC.1
MDDSGGSRWSEHIRTDGATRRSAPFAIATVDCSNDQEDDFDLVDVDEEQPPMAHTGQVDGLEE